MAAPPTHRGITGIVISRARRARLSSPIAIATPTPMTMRKVDFTVNRVTTTRAPRPAPTAAAAGRLRPDRDDRSSAGWAACPASLSAPGISLAWAVGPLSMSWPCSWRSKLDLEELGFLVLEQLVHLRDVGVRQIVELALGPAHVVLPRVPVLGQLVEGVLRVPPDVADGDPAVLRLA